uniref:Nerve growth factor receptor n=1 Tax=Anas platyrhynchos platyrhynchos TaxID=8840 RepID=A0A493T8G0_ANAPP
MYTTSGDATEPCKPCTQCVGLQSMSAPCVESDDAVCRCAYGYYQDELSGSCKECRVCEVGFGLMFPCRDSQDTVCEECPEGTFSDEANFVDPCLPCTICEENEVMVKECTATSDAECRGTEGLVGACSSLELAKCLGHRVAGDVAQPRCGTAGTRPCRAHPEAAHGHRERPWRGAGAGLGG